MSESEKKSHIPDEQLAKLTERKLQELEQERRELKGRLAEQAPLTDTAAGEQQRLERQISNHDSASDKLTKYHEDMLEGQEQKGKSERP